MRWMPYRIRKLALVVVIRVPQSAVLRPLAHLATTPKESTIHPTLVRLDSAAQYY